MQSEPRQYRDAILTTNATDHQPLLDLEQDQVVVPNRHRLPQLAAAAIMGLLETLDSGITDLVGQWNGYSTGLVTLLVAIVSYRIVSHREPDVHPMLLAKQSSASTVRNEGESAVYRSHAAPHSMPLNAGLNVKDPGASKWARGRDGDLRDVWRKATGAGAESAALGKILTVLGSEKVVEHKLGMSQAPPPPSDCLPNRRLVWSLGD
jgi:hypothetical protein